MDQEEKEDYFNKLDEFPVTVLIEFLFAAHEDSTTIILKKEDATFKKGATVKLIALKQTEQYELET